MKTITILLFFTLALNISAPASNKSISDLHPNSIDTIKPKEVNFDIKQIQNALGADVFIMIPAGLPQTKDIKVLVKDLFGNLVFESHLEYFDQVIELSFELDKGYYRLSIDAGETHFLKNLTIH